MVNSDDPNTELGLHIQQLRRERGLTQARVAQLAKADWSKSYVSRLESGRIQWRPDLLLIMSDALAMDPRDLLPPEWSTSISTKEELQAGHIRAIAATFGLDEDEIIRRLTGGRSIGTPGVNALMAAVQGKRWKDAMILLAELAYEN